jgi:chemotaxis response regulator CheB
MAISVLLVDNHTIMRKAIARLLTGDPEIEVVAQGVSFAQTMELTTKLRPQVVVMDLHMADERVVKPSQVKSCLNGSRLLAMSLWNDDETKALAEAFGAVTLLDKTNLATQLIRAVKQHPNGNQ